MITGRGALLLFLLRRYPQLPVARGVHALIVAPRRTMTPIPSRPCG